MLVTWHSVPHANIMKIVKYYNDAKIEDYRHYKDRKEYIYIYKYLLCRGNELTKPHYE